MAALAMANAALQQAMDGLHAAQVGCTDDAVCSNRPKLSTMAGLTGLSCVSVTASALTTAKMSSVCRFGCTAPYVPLQFVLGGDTVVTGGCWNTAVPTACSTFAETTSSSSDSSSSSSITRTKSICSTPAAGSTFSTATLAQQSCVWGEKLAVLGGPDTCRALCPDGFTATTSSSDAFCTSTAGLPAPLSKAPDPTPPPSSAAPLASPSPSPGPAPSPEPAATSSPKGKKVVIVNSAPAKRGWRAALSGGMVAALLGTLIARCIWL